MNRRFHTIVAGAMAVGALISAIGATAVLAQRQADLRGALNGMPDASMPRREPLLGVNVELTQYSPEELETNLDQIKSAGFTWVRQTFDWSAIERERGKYDWAAYDAILREARERNLRPVAVIWRSPEWAAASPTAPPSNMRDFSTFAKVLAERYYDSIDVYQIWDEPNLSSGWGNELPDPILYAEMLEGAYRAIHGADPDAMVLTAGLAPTVEAGPVNLSDVLYLRSLYENDAQPFFDGIAGKPYGFNSSPSERQIDMGTLNFARMVLLREEMERHSDGGKPVWASHFGWWACPYTDCGRSQSIWGIVQADQQAEWTVDAYRRAMTEWAWAGPLILESWQPDLPSNDPHWGFALKDPDGQISQTGEAISVFAKQANRTLWPGVYRPNTALAEYSGEWEFSELGADIGESGNSEVDIPFTGGPFGLLARRDNYRAYLYVTLDGKPSPDLPRDEQGHAYAILSSADKMPHVDLLTLASPADTTSTHRVHIQADRGWDQWAVAGFAVANRMDTSGYDLMLGSLGAAFFVFAAVILRQLSVLGWPPVLKPIIDWITKRLSIATHLALTLIAALAAWLGMAITWGGVIPEWLRKLGDGPSLLITLLTAGIFYASPWVIVTMIALVALFILIAARPVIGLALIMAFTPYYLLPRQLFDRALGMLEATTLLTLAAWLVHTLAERKSKGWLSLRAIWGSMTGLDKAVLAFVGIATLAISWSSLIGVAITDLRQMVLEPTVMYLILRTTRLTDKERWLIVHLLIATGVIVSIMGFVQFAQDWARSPGEFTCLRGTFGTCNNAALYLTRLIPICAAVAVIGQERALRWLYSAAGIAMLAATGLTVSRGGLLFGLTAGLAVVVIVWLGRKGVIAVAVGLALEVLALIPLAMFVPRFANLFDLSSGSSSSFFRTQVWTSTLALLRDHPITGVGMDQFLYAYRGRYILPGAWQQPDLSQPHNFLLNYWVRLGIVGLGIAAWLHVEFWKKALKTVRRINGLDPQRKAMAAGIMGGMAAMVAHGMVDETHFVIDLAFIFFAGLGLMHQLAEEADGNHSQQPHN